MKDWGTIERWAHGKVQKVFVVHQEDGRVQCAQEKWESLLDHIFDAGALGVPAEAAVRYGAGTWLREQYFRCRLSRPVTLKYGAIYYRTGRGTIMAPWDDASTENKRHIYMRTLGKCEPYACLLQDVCVYDLPRRNMGRLLAGLDLLAKVIRAVPRERRGTIRAWRAAA